MTGGRIRGLVARARASRLFAPAALAVVAALAAYVLSVTVFPYHSTNHDEAVYLQQAAMLLDGKLFLHPPVEGSFRPWFFVDSPHGLYSKYSPAVPVIYALGEIVGEYRYALPAVAAANVALLYGVVREAFDHRTSVLAGVVLLCSPLFLVQSAVFLPYAPTTMLNLAFALAYFRAERTGSVRLAAVAGIAVGLAFFSRPYTAVLFATPFIVHAVWTLREQLRERHVSPLFRRRVATAGLGLCGVAVALAYNAVVTGDPLVFPYQAFAPLDGLGFGRREILNHEIQYTPRLALRANASVLEQFVTEWAPLGVLGVPLAAVGVLVTHRRGWAWQQAVLAGVAASVVVGNIYFWGNFNVLGDVEDPNGLITTLGPYYHFDLLVPVSTFAATGVLAAADRVRDAAASRLSTNRAVAATLAVLLVASAAIGGVAASATAEQVRDSAELTDHYEAAYEPFEPRPPANSVVFLPDPYGDWLNHPFQPLRNDPGFDGRTVYAVDERPLAVAEEYPDRALYRYVYRGSWSPYGGDPVDPDLRQIHVASGELLTVNAELGLPSWTETVTLTLSAGDEETYLTLTPRNASRANVDLEVTDGRTRLSAGGESASIPVADGASVALDAHVDGGYGAGFAYRVRFPVERADGEYRTMTPYRELCTDLQNCEGGAAYVPGVGPDGTYVNTSVRNR